MSGYDNNRSPTTSSMQTRCMAVDKGRWSRSEQRIGSVKVRRKSAWLLHFVAALAIRLALQLDKSTVLVVELRRHQLGATGLEDQADTCGIALTWNLFAC